MRNNDINQNKKSPRDLKQNLKEYNQKMATHNNIVQ